MITVAIVKYRHMNEEVPKSITCPDCSRKVFLTINNYMICGCKKSGTLNLHALAEHLTISGQRRYLYHKDV